MSKLFLLLLFLTPQVYAQSNIGTYFWKNVIILEQCDIDFNPIAAASKVLSKPKQKFRVIDENATHVLIYILDYNQPDTNPNYIKYNYADSRASYNGLTTTEKATKKGGAKQKYFKIKIKDFEANAISIVKIPFALSAGVINYPFKMRPGDEKIKMDFTGAFNFGAAVGLKFPYRQHNKISFSLITGYSLSNIVLDSASVTKNKMQLTGTNNFTAFSFSVGAMAEYEKVQVGFFIGWDWLNRINQETYNWEYQGRTWLSIGLGLAIFSTKKEIAPDQSIINFGKS